ncbi:hypothetical protein HHI36_008825 [Cryptolaemus montrouzieri]|uniref:Uncharacterized protein n=1 Tax=Cryptolaemus montrouzieri TaxID=559131 RepID=A0ABD2MUF2_9CUCU
MQYSSHFTWEITQKSNRSSLFIYYSSRIKRKMDAEMENHSKPSKIKLIIFNHRTKDNSSMIEFNNHNLKLTAAGKYLENKISLKAHSKKTKQATITSANKASQPRLHAILRNDLPT